MNVDLTIVRDEVTPKLRLLADRWPQEHRQALYAAGSVVQRLAMGNLSGRRLRARSNRLRSSVVTEVRGDEVAIGSNVVYARIHELGGEIVPRTAPALVFRTEDGAFHRVQRVSMPARHWLSAALEESWGKVREVFETAIAKLID